MRRFVVQLLLFGAMLVVSAELFLQVSGLASDVMDRELSTDQILVFQPGASGYRTRGMRAEVHAPYQINAQGWNSRIDYDQVDSTTVAVVGDSYIAGFWNTVDSTVAACLQYQINELAPNVEVHSYGHPGANFHDYENLTTYLRNRGYQYIYIYLGPKDFNAKKPAFTNRKKADKRTGIRYWYRKSALLKYINVNLGLQELLVAKTNRRAAGKKAIASGRAKALERLEAFPDQEVVFFYQDEFFDTLAAPNQLLKVVHTLQPIDHGFNRHWNTNGNKNAALTILDRKSVV